MIRELFNERDVALILKISTGGASSHDRLSWLLDPKGIYSVQSLHHHILANEVLLTELRLERHLECPCHPKGETFCLKNLL